MFVGADVAASCLIVKGPENRRADAFAADAAVAFFLVASFTLAHGAAGIYFFIQANNISIALVDFMSKSRAGRRFQNQRQILRIIMWLTATGFACLVVTIILVFFIVGLMGGLAHVHSGVPWMVTVVAFSAGRIGISYCQVSGFLL